MLKRKDRAAYKRDKINIYFSHSDLSETNFEVELKQRIQTITTWKINIVVMSQQVQTLNVPLFACKPEKTQRKFSKITMSVSVSNWVSIHNASESYRNAAK